MAIQKTKILPSGQVGNYWRIRGVYLSPDASGVRAFADLYVDAATATSGTPIFSEDVLLFGQNNPIGSEVIIDLVENQLVSMPGDFVSGTILEG